VCVIRVHAHMLVCVLKYLYVYISVLVLLVSHCIVYACGFTKYICMYEYTCHMGAQLFMSTYTYQVAQLVLSRWHDSIIICRLSTCAFLAYIFLLLLSIFFSSSSIFYFGLFCFLFRFLFFLSILSLQIPFVLISIH